MKIDSHQHYSQSTGTDASSNESMFVSHN